MQNSAWCRVSRHPSSLLILQTGHLRLRGEGGTCSRTYGPGSCSIISVPAATLIPLLSVEGARGQESIKCFVISFFKKLKALIHPSLPVPKGPQTGAISFPEGQWEEGTYLPRSSRTLGLPGSSHSKLGLSKAAGSVGGETGWSSGPLYNSGRTGKPPGCISWEEREAKGTLGSEAGHVQSQPPTPSPLFHCPEPGSLGQS